MAFGEVDEVNGGPVESRRVIATLLGWEEPTQGFWVRREPGQALFGQVGRSTREYFGYLAPGISPEDEAEMSYSSAEGRGISGRSRAIWFQEGLILP